MKRTMWMSSWAFVYRRSSTKFHFTECSVVLGSFRLRPAVTVKPSIFKTRWLIKRAGSCALRRRAACREGSGRERRLKGPLYNLEDRALGVGVAQTR